MKKFFLLGMIALLSFAACKKDKKEEPKTRTDYLTAAPWVYEAVADTTPDDCLKDDKITFKSDFSMVADFGTVPCNAVPAIGPQQGNWSLVDNDNTLIFVINAGVPVVDTLSIIKLDENTFEFEGKVILGKTKMKH